MKARLESLSPRALTIGAVAAVVVYAAVVWLLLVSPKRGDAADAARRVAAAETQARRGARGLEPPAASAGAPVADVFRLAKAMPGSDDQPGLVLELDRLARATGVTLRVIAPQEPLAAWAARRRSRSP